MHKFDKKLAGWCSRGSKTKKIMPAWYILPIIAVLNFVIGFLVLKRDWKAPVNRAFFGFAAAVGMWVLVDFLLMEAWSERAAILFGQLSHLMGVFIAATLWIFAHLFNQRGQLRKTQWRVVQWPTAIMALATMWPGVLAKQAIIHSWGPEVFIRPAYHIAFAVYFAVFFFGGLMSLRPRERFGRTKLVCRQARCLYRGLILTAVGGVFFNIVLISPFIQQHQFAWVGPIFTIFFIMGAYRAKRLYFFGIPKVVNVVTLVEDLPLGYLKIIRFLKLFFSRRFWVKI